MAQRELEAHRPVTQLGEILPELDAVDDGIAVDRRAVAPVKAGDRIAPIVQNAHAQRTRYFGVDGRASKLESVVDSLNTINVDLDLQDAIIPYSAMVDATLTKGLFDGKMR